MADRRKPLRAIDPPFIALGPSGVAIRTSLKHLTSEDDTVLRLVGAHLGSLASKDLRRRCVDGLEHSADTWAERKRALTQESSSRWAGSITKATHDQWALSRRAQLAHIQGLEAGIRTIAHRLSLPVGEKGDKRVPGGYRTAREWFAKTRRLHVLEDRLITERADRQAGRVRVTRGGKRLLNTRHHLDKAQLTAGQWRRRWEAERWFLAADGESGKRFGNETIRVTPDGEVSLKLPAPLAHLANAEHGRYVLVGAVAFHHRGDEWADRVGANRAVAYRIHHDVDRGRWYVTASWTIPPALTVSLDQARIGGLIGVDTNADHLAAWRLDQHGNPVGEPRRFFYDLSGNTQHRDAQVRHALTRLLHWAARHHLSVAVEDLDFTGETTREKHGHRKRFRKLISGMPVARLRARLVGMAAELGVTIVAVDPAYTSMWGAEHWQKPLTSKTRKTTRHDAASVAIGRRALGHRIRRRTAPPPQHRRDVAGHRTAQAGCGTRGREEPRPRIPGPRARPGLPDAERTRATSASTTVRDAPDTQVWVQDSLLLTE
ncbi:MULTISPECIES: IS200/IS605 family element transposase accessory protein TnpB [unclassified Streptomyces]|uniref:IS200/IS605 family element transposase accessory protein TnpB n=1 Tax=unclassified Streptomyces TaxID=2593676 RepID=UPI0007EC3C4C|nr:MULTISPECIES: IS200/IS605 family element transposase accessory protein TnpB [unclassified Streptomyces]MCP3766013.1 IS200/IS605 family element transposase accessory protein TnpB [Streptomyces sp. MAR25Y5]OBQ47727.1 transposase [Streptomyces sp. H-KF8]